MATTKNIGQILVDKAKELDPTYKSDKFIEKLKAEGKLKSPTSK